MERQLVTIQTIEEIKSIEDAEQIVATRIKGWWVVVRKDEFKVGDAVLFYEIDSFLPLKSQYEFLLKGNKPKKMLVDGGEVEGIRLRTIKLRGQISQGLILPFSVFPEYGLNQFVSDTDVTELMGVIKYEMPIPAQLTGIVKGSFPSFIPKTDEERIQNMADVLNGFYVTEKLDGTSVTYYKKDGVFGVCSRNLELAEGNGTQWRLAKEMDLIEKLPDNFVLQGEIVGEGIQGNYLKLKGQKVYFYNAYNIATGIYLNFGDFLAFCLNLRVLTVPIIDQNFTLPSVAFDLYTSLNDMLNYAKGKSIINPNTEREGIVVRPQTELQYKGQRLSFKVINNEYLLNEK